MRYLRLRQALLVWSVAALSLCSGSMWGQGAYVIRHDTMSASGWYGGDNRNPRSVGVGQGVRVTSSILLTKFSFKMIQGFDFTQNPTGTGHQVTLTLQVRDSLGAILKRDSVVVPASYTGGLVTWTDLNLNVQKNTFLIFTSYLVGAFNTNQYWNGSVSDQFNLYLPGDQYVAEDTSDARLDNWANWALHNPWDSNFLLEGQLLTGVSETQGSLPSGFALEQNYPNPFNPSTTIQYSLAVRSNVTLRVFDVLGQHVATLVNQVQEAGPASVRFDAAGLASGVYLYQLRAGNFTRTNKLLLMR